MTIKSFKVVLVLIIPILLLLFILQITSFSDSFYSKEFTQYNVYNNVNNASAIHKKVVNFVQGKNEDLPIQFNDREKEHLKDVRKLVVASKIVLIILVALFLSISFIAVCRINSKSQSKKFFGDVLKFGGVLTLAIFALLQVFMQFSFSQTFESFHRIFFKRGTYAFDPSTELIVNLYPEELFRDLGVRIFAYAVASAIAISLLGMLLTYRNKKNK